MADPTQDDLSVTPGSGNVFTDLGFTREEAATLLVQAGLVAAILQITVERDWSDAQVVAALGIDPKRLSLLRRGKLSKFSVDLLLQYLARLGKRIEYRVVDDETQPTYNIVRFPSREDTSKK